MTEDHAGAARKFSRICIESDLHIVESSVEGAQSQLVQYLNKPRVSSSS